MSPEINCYRINLFKKLRYQEFTQKEKIYHFQPENISNFKYISENNYIYFKIIKKFANEVGVKYIWFFNEPFLEVTWYSEVEQARKICDLVESFWDTLPKNTDSLEIMPTNNSWADWYCNSEEEREFGGKVHSLCADFATLYNEYKNSIDKGKGLEKQIERTIHRLCNPLGLSYKEEYKICFRRGLICWLFQYFTFKKLFGYIEIFFDKSIN